ncbi:MAG: flavin reductase [Bacilli bacterium]|nr:flavin reductase [Bacilli bacterium]
MAEFKEISIQEIAEYKDPFSLFADWAAASAKGKEKANSLLIGWGGLGILWSKPCCTVYIHESRYSKKIFDEADSFSVCFFSRERFAKELAYLGKVSGRGEDKMSGCGLTAKEEKGIPYFEEAELVIFCKKMGQSKFDPEKISSPERIIEWYRKDGVHTLYFGEIIKVLRKVG